MSHAQAPGSSTGIDDWQRAQLPVGVARHCAPGTRLYYSAKSHCKVLVSIEPGVGWHLSISHPFRAPTWEAIKSARYALVPHDVTMAMMLPPPSEFVNVHEYCFHLHQCECGR